MSNYNLGDPQLQPQDVQGILRAVKESGLFDQLRKECIADVDTKPAYQNLRFKVENTVSSFLAKQKWTPETNRNQLREKLRKNLLDSSYLESGIERVVEQVINPKLQSFQSQVEDLLCKHLNIVRPKKKGEVEETKDESLLPTDLEAVSSPESEKKFEVADADADSKSDDDFESPAFEPIEAYEVVKKEGSTESHLSGLSALSSNEDGKQLKIDEAQESQLSVVSSGSRLSIVLPSEKDTSSPKPLEVFSEEAQMPKFNENSNSIDYKASIKEYLTPAFDFKREEIEFQGTDRKMTLDEKLKEEILESEKRTNLPYEHETMSHSSEMKLEIVENQSFDVKEESKVEFPVSVKKEEDEKSSKAKSKSDDRRSSSKYSSSHKSHKDRHRRDRSRSRDRKKDDKKSSSSRDKHKKHERDRSKERRGSRSRDRKHSKDDGRKDHKDEGRKDDRKDSRDHKKDSHRSRERDRDKKKSSEHHSSDRRSDRKERKEVTSPDEPPKLEVIDAPLPSAPTSILQALLAPEPPPEPPALPELPPIPEPAVIPEPPPEPPVYIPEPEPQMPELQPMLPEPEQEYLDDPTCYYLNPSSPDDEIPEMIDEKKVEVLNDLGTESLSDEEPAFDEKPEEIKMYTSDNEDFMGFTEEEIGNTIFTRPTETPKKASKEPDLNTSLQEEDAFYGFDIQNEQSLDSLDFLQKRSRKPNNRYLSEEFDVSIEADKGEEPRKAPPKRKRSMDAIKRLKRETSEDSKSSEDSKGSSSKRRK